MTDWTWHKRAQASIAQSYLTNSKRPEAFISGIYPTHIVKGHGAHVWDTNGKKYLDFVTGLGTSLLGYSHERIVGAIGSRLRGGFSHSLATTLEVETAEKLKQLFTFVDCVKFLKTGGEATSAAIRIARAATGRERILSAGYHGWHDQFVSLTEPALGVPDCDECGLGIGKYFENLTLSGVAAVIVEPVITDWSDERRMWLQQLREKCTKAGALLIFDEIITGLRWPRFSVAGYWGITPDLICLGKALAGGMPLAAVGGKYDVMNCGEYFVSSTYAGETLSLAAAKETMTLLQTKYDIKFLWDKGLAFQKRFNEIGCGVVGIEGYPTRGILVGPGKALFMQEACKAGLLFGVSFWFNFPLAEVAAETLVVIESIVAKIRSGSVALEGQAPQSPFAQKVRQ